MPPRYTAGSRVRVRRTLRPGHIRTPLFLFGKPGVIAEVVGEFPDPERLAYGEDGLPPVPLYFVAFDPREVWGDRAPRPPAKDTIYVELYEHWLEPA